MPSALPKFCAIMALIFNNLRFGVTSMNRVVSVFVLILTLAVSAFAQGFTFDNLLATRRVSDPQLSPDGRTVAFTVGTADKAGNRVVNHIYRLDIEGTNLRQLTSGAGSHSSPRWSPDGRLIAFTTGSQIWTMEPDGDDRKQITRISTGASNPVWSP